MFTFTVALLLASALLDHTPCSNAEGCDDYTVSLRQDSFLTGSDVEFVCKYKEHHGITIPLETISIETRANKTGLNRHFKNRYIYYADYPEATGPSSGKLESRLSFKFTGPTVTLTTLEKATFDDALYHKYWRCTVNSDDCSNINKVDITLHLTDPYFNDVHLFVDGEHITNTTSHKQKNGAGQIIVVCSATSDPQAAPEILGAPSRSGSAITDHVCERLGGEIWTTGNRSTVYNTEGNVPPQPWVCNVSATVNLEGDVNISCKASWEGHVFKSPSYSIISTKTSTTISPYMHAGSTKTPLHTGRSISTYSFHCAIFLISLCFTILNIII